MNRAKKYELGVNAIPKLSNNHFDILIPNEFPKKGLKLETDAIIVNLRWVAKQGNGWLTRYVGG